MTMRKTGSLLVCASIFLGSLTLGAAVQAATDALDQAIAASHRSASNVERDVYRNPKATLAFFDVRPGATVVEIWPGSGWYTEILAPLLKDNGTYYAAHFPALEEPAFFKRARDMYEEKLAGDPDVYAEVKVTSLLPPNFTEMAPAGTADVVLTFRNVHNWMNNNSAEAMFKAAYTALKPGGVLGVVEHRAKPGTSVEAMIKSGYVTEQRVKDYAAEAGFVFVAASEVNANPKDTTDHPQGVWTLPPTLRLKEVDRDKYLAIGESDRMTLKFVKPE